MRKARCLAGFTAQSWANATCGLPRPPDPFGVNGRDRGNLEVAEARLEQRAISAFTKPKGNNNMSAFALDARVHKNTLRHGADVEPQSLGLLTRVVCTKVSCKTCGCTPLCISQSPLTCW
jgi:hypothetical protein